MLRFSTIRPFPTLFLGHSWLSQQWGNRVTVLLPVLSVCRNVSTGVYRTGRGVGGVVVRGWLFFLPSEPIQRQTLSVLQLLANLNPSKAKQCFHHFSQLAQTLGRNIMHYIDCIILYINIQVCNYTLSQQTRRNYYWLLTEARHDYNWSPRWTHPTALITGAIVTMD